MYRFIFSFFSLLISLSFTAQNPISLESLLSTSYCSSLYGSPDGKAIAWVEEKAGVRTLYASAGPDFSPHLLYSSGKDDGQEIGQIQFTPDHQTLFFVCGGSSNRQGEIPNPASYTQYPSRELKMTSLTGGPVKSLGQYSGAILSPDGKYLLVPQGGRLSRLDPATGKIELLVQMRGSFSNVSVHPKTGKILFASNRGDHSFIGYLNSGEDPAIHWVAPSLSRDGEPVWSPDGSEIAFLRLPGLEQGELTNLTGGISFAVMKYNVTDQQAVTLWQSPSDDGGFAQYYPSHPILWPSENVILFYSEHEDWMKLYRINASGGTPEPLLPGACEIEHQSVDPTGEYIYVSSNCSSIDLRDLSRINIRTGAVESFLETDAIETNPVALSDGQVAYRKSSATLPTAIYLWNGRQEKRLFPTQPDPSFLATLVTPEQVVFETADHWQIHGQLFRPKGKPNGGAIIFMHGGPIRQMLLGFHYSSYYANAYSMNQYLTSLGYMVMSVNYRSGIGYGRLFRRAPQQGPRGASEYQDIVAAAHFLQTLPGVDAAKIGLWGGSYGGYLTAMGLARNSDLFKAGVDLHGVHDWSWRARDFSPGGAWGINEALMDDAYNSSPISEVGKWRSPVLLIHGDDDRNVMFGQSIDLARKLDAHRVPYEVLVLPDEVHGFLRYASWLEAYRRGAQFFNTHLLGK